jgi:uncharacterized protein (TIGR00304 family)
MAEMTSLTLLGLMLIILGFTLIFIAVIKMFFVGVHAHGKVRGGGLIMIGPFPIIFGTDREAVKILMILSIVLIAVVLISMFVLSQTLLLR